MRSTSVKVCPEIMSRRAFVLFHQSHNIRNQSFPLLRGSLAVVLVMKTTWRNIIRKPAPILRVSDYTLGCNVAPCRNRVVTCNFGAPSFTEHLISCVYDAGAFSRAQSQKQYG